MRYTENTLLKGTCKTYFNKSPMESKGPILPHLNFVPPSEVSIRITKCFTLFAKLATGTLSFKLMESLLADEVRFPGTDLLVCPACEVFWLRGEA